MDATIKPLNNKVSMFASNDELYDEFGNYVGPDLGSEEDSAEESGESDASDSEDEAFKVYT